MSPRVVNTLRLITKEILSDVGVLEFGDALVDVDAVKLDVLGDGVHDFVNAAVVEDIDVLKEVLSDFGVVELVALDVAVKHDMAEGAEDNVDALSHEGTRAMRK
mmetsp:Transcript_38287/g.88397  ORF Transcript_38287/g.88397 Transcript_38287/m.88397 type:complete len:104 (+) Transcript_38287:100-411(+)